MYPEEFYEFEQIFGGMGEEILLMMAGIIGVIAMVVSLVTLVGYVLQSIGLYTIARNRGIKNPWLPIGYYWIAGSIADQYQYVSNGQVKNKRTILLALSLASAVVASLVSSMVTGSFVLTTGEVSAEQLAALGSMGTLLNLVTSGLEIATFVFWQMALYDLYTSCDPKNNVLFLVLGIIFGVTIPYFIFFSRKKELGMPARKPEPEAAQWQPQDPPADPWDNT